MSQISQLPTAADFDTSSLFAIDNPDPNSSGDYLTRKVSAAEVADYIANDLDYTTDLDTTNKKITGAINELKDNIKTANYWKTEKLTIANDVSVNAGVETQPVTVTVPQYTGYTVLTFTEVRATGYHGAKVTVQAELATANELVYALYNPSNVNATVTVTVRVIYVKTIA